MFIIQLITIIQDGQLSWKTPCSYVRAIGLSYGVHPVPMVRDGHLGLTLTN